MIAVPGLAVPAIGPIGASAIPNGQSYYQRLSVGSSTLYMEANSNLYTINTATGAATQVGTTDSNGYLSSVLLLEYGIYYVATGSGIASINVGTGQIDPHSSVFGPAGTPVALAPDPLITPVWGFIENRVATSLGPAPDMPYKPVVVEPKVARLGVPVTPPMRVRFALAVLTE